MTTEKKIVEGRGSGTDTLGHIEYNHPETGEPMVAWGEFPMNENGDFVNETEEFIVIGIRPRRKERVG